MRRSFWLVFKLLCYLALLTVVAGVCSLMLVSNLGVCPRLNEGDISCTTPFYGQIANFGMGVVLATVFTGLPGLLAVGGLVFLIRDLWSLRQRKPQVRK